MIRRIFSNTCSVQNFPQPGLESKTLDWLLEHAKVPVEAEEVQCLKVMLALCSWDWGIRVLCAHDGFIQYLTERDQVNPNEVMVLKYEIVKKAI